MTNFAKMEAVDCSCEECRSCCKRRICWGTPDDAQRIIDAGLGHRLMYDWWVGGHYENTDWEADDFVYKNIDLLCPASVGREGDRAHSGIVPPDEPCTFYSELDGCELHALGIKPTEGKLTLICNPRETKGLHEWIAQQWNNPEAQALANKWIKESEKKERQQLQTGFPEEGDWMPPPWLTGRIVHDQILK